MHDRGIIIVLLFIVICSGTRAQDISHRVLVPLASVTEVNYHNLNQTVGEPVVQLLESVNYDLTQGFHQPSISLRKPDPPEGNGVEVYPNPVVDFLKVELFGVVPANFEIMIFSMDGSVFYINDIQCGRDYWRIERIDLSSYKRGMYFVRVRASDGRIQRIFKIEKM